MNRKYNIILITRGYPYGRGEAFLSDEIGYLAETFSTITIFAQTELIYEGFDKNEKRETPANVTVFKIPPIQKRKVSFRNFGYILAELSFLFSNKKLSMINIKTMLAYYSDACQIASFINKNIKNNNRSIIGYSYWAYMEPLSLIFLKKKKPELKTIVSRVHGADLYEERQPGRYLPFRKLYINNLDRICPVSYLGTNYLISKYGTDKNNIVTSYLGVYGEPNFQPNIDTQNRIVSIGALYDLKRIDLIIDSLSKIKDLNIIWEHFGTGPDEKEIHNKAQEHLSKKQNVKYNFHGYVTHKEIINFLKKTKISTLLSLSSSEGIPVSMMEAMSFGIPVIATNVGGVHEIVNDKNGILLNSNPTPIEVSVQLQKFLELTEDEKLNFRKNARKMWLDTFNAEKNYKLFIEEILK